MAMNIKTTRMIGGVIGLIVAGAAIYSVFFMEWKGEVEEAPELIRPVKVHVVSGERVTLNYKYLGTVEAAEKADLAFDVSGMLIKLSVKTGEMVEKGQELAKLDPRDYENALRVAKAEARKQRKNLKRIRPAVKSGAVTKKQLTDSEAATETAEARLKIQEKALQDTIMLAPFSGVVADVMVDNYERINAKQVVMSIQGQDGVDIEVDIPESRAAQIDPKWRKVREVISTFTVNFDYFAGHDYEVKVKEFSTEADRLTQTYRATFTMPIPQDITLLPGMPATVTEVRPISIGTDKGFSLPLAAVPVDTSGEYFVWLLVKEEGDMFRVERKVVKVGDMSADQIVVKEGVSNGDLIAAAGVHILREGQMVRRLEEMGVTE